MKFTKEQAEGLARFIDTIASAAFIGAIVGASGHSPLSTAEIVALFAVCPTLLAASFFLRKPQK